MFSEMPATCSVTPEQEVGPFYVADELLRSAIAEDKPGLPLALRIAVLDARTCRPLPQAAVDLWHCDASGLYSGYTKSAMSFAGPGGEGGPPPGGGDRFGPPPNFGGGGGDGPDGGPPRGGQGGPPQMKPTDKLTFCRGIQLTDAVGQCHFETIFPGFYQGRVNHVHMKVRLGGSEQGRTYAAGHTSHAGQIFFPEELAVALMQRAPYSAHHIHRTTMAEDGVYNGQHGESMVAAVVPLAAGYRASVTLYVDPTATPAPVGGGFGGPPPGARGPRF